MRLIDADELKPNIDKFIGYLDEDMIYRIKFVIDNAPTALVDNYSLGYQDGVRQVLSERPTGELLDYLNGKYECSVCHKELVEEVRFYPRCPWCGAFLTTQTPVVDKEAENVDD